MNIFLTLKCGKNDSVFFIQQFSTQNNIEQVYTFRDIASDDLPKVKYITSLIPAFGSLNFLFRVFQMLLYFKAKPSLIVGIYEIPHGLIAMIVGKLLNKPSVISIIGNPAYTKLRHGFRLQLTMWLLKHTDFITVTGNASKNFLSSKGINERKIFVLPNTMDFDGFYPVPGLQKEFDIISLGRLSDEKKVDQILRIIFELKKQNSNIRAAIGGTGPERKTLEDLSNTLNLTDNVTFLGFVPDEDLGSFFSKGKVFVLTSETEGFPRTIIQAAACGVPVVASNVGDMTDVIEHGENGLLVQQWSDTKSFVHNIQLLLDDEALRKQFSQKLEKKVRNQFHSTEAYKIWQLIFSQVQKKHI